MQRNGSPAPVFETDEERSYFLICLPIRARFVEEPQATRPVTKQVVRLLIALKDGEESTKQLMEDAGLKYRPGFLESYLQPALTSSLVEMTQPDLPRSPTQKYRLTAFGKHLLASQQPHSTD